MIRLPTIKIPQKKLRVLAGMLLLIVTAFTGAVVTTEVDIPSVLGEYTDSFEVVNVVDGDTIVVKVEGENKTVRFIGIDTPELKHPRKEIECFAEEASKKTKELLLNEKILLKEDPTQQNLDRYGRLLRYVYLTDGTLVNELLIRQGFAYEYTYKVPYLLQKEFIEAQNQARETESGLWGGACL